MKIIKAVVVVFIATFLLASISQAEKMVEPKVEYSADRIMETEQMTMESRVYHAPGKVRTETGGSIMIMRFDKGVMWTLMPSEEMYMERSMTAPEGKGAPKAQDESGYTIDEQKVVGKEVVNGVETTKTKVVMTMSDGSKFGNFT